MDQNGRVAHSLPQNFSSIYLEWEHSFEGREIQKSTRYKLIYEKLLEPGQTSMKRTRNTRKRTEALIVEAVASNVATQEWGKEIAKECHAANKGLLQFKDAAIKRIIELEELSRYRSSTSLRDTTTAQSNASLSPTPTT